MRTLKRSDLPGEFGIPLYVIPSRSPIAQIIDASFVNLTRTLGNGLDESLYVFHIDTDYMLMVLDADDREELSRYQVKYHPTPDEVVTALTGPTGPVGPQGATGMKGDSA